VRRADLVKVKEGGNASVDPSVLAKVLATTCAISNKPLANPVVSDKLGRLYNKDSVVKYLLKRAESQKSKEDVVAGHIKGLKDVKELKLESNPSFTREIVASKSTEEELPAPFICPLTQREMKGKHRFVYLATCGCVMSESGLRGVVSEQTSEQGQEQVASCPVCGVAFSTASLAKREILPGGDVVIINGTEGEVEAMRKEMERKKEIELARKKELKAKDANGEESEEKRKKREEKRKRKEEVIKLLEAEERKARRIDMVPAKAEVLSEGEKGQNKAGKEMSAAVRSIYGLDKPKQTGETWMTRGTFNRFA
jgi:hypothetical protein